jgi:hypothetical protein
MGKKCSMVGCGGEIDMGAQTFLQTGCQSVSPAYPCNKCRRLHWDNGIACFNRPGNPVYLKDGYPSLVNVQHLEAYTFRTVEELKLRDFKQATLAGELACRKDLKTPFGEFVLYWNPRTQRWVSSVNYAWRLLES